MVVGDASIHNIMGGMESTAGVRLHNHRRKLKQRFDIIKKLGQGTYGKVQLGINKETGQEVAIKTIKKAKIETEADLVRIRREIQIMSSVQHPNIIHIYEVFENREKMVLVMEYAAGGELYDYLSERKVLAQEEARRIFRQIATAVYYCHKHKICHRDLKLENILLDEHGSAKIADFGLSNVFDEQRLLNTFCGSPLYASPEIVKGTPYHGPEVDCWSLGVLLYTLVYGAMPFDGSNFKRLVKQISQGDYFEPKKPSPASPLIRDMLTVNPARRADIEKICSHWWVNEGYTESCLDIAEELANQTPVRLDLLLSLAPPAPGVGSDKLLVTKEQGSEGGAIGGNLVPARCHSVGSLMELDHPSAERRIKEFEKEKQRENGSADGPKRKLEEGVSTEEANQGGAKRKERSRRRDREKSSDRRHHRSSSRNKQTSENSNRTALELKDESPNVEQNEELMDIDMELAASTLQEIDPSLRESEETIVGSLKAAASSVETIGGSSSAVHDSTTPTENVEMSPKSPEKPVVTKERTTRKSVKKKSKSVSDTVAGVETVDNKTSEKITIETGDEKKELPASEPSTNEGINSGEPVEEVKIKVKRKKQVPGELKLDESAGVPDDGKVLTEENKKEVEVNGNIDGNFSGVKDTKETSTERSKDTEVSATLDTKERIASKPIEVPKKTGLKARKSKGELSLGKQGSSSEKSSGTNTPEDTASPPTRPMERRRSKIFETAEKFNTLLSGGSEPKSPTTEKPKKVFIPGVKVSDAKRAFERKSSLPETSLPSFVKNTVSKKASDTNLETVLKGAPQENSSEQTVIQKIEKKPVDGNEKKSSLTVSKDKEKSEIVTDLPKTQQSSRVEKEGEIDNKSVKSDGPDKKQGTELKGEEDGDLRLVPALQVTDKAAQQEEARIKKLKDAVEIISNAIAEESRKENISDTSKKVSSAKPPVPVSGDAKARIRSVGVTSPTSPKSPPPSPLDPSSGKKTVRVQVAPNDVRLATIQVSTPETTKFSFNDSDVSKVKTDKSGTDSANVNVLKQVTEAVSESNEVSSKGPKVVDEATGKKKSAKVEIILKSATLPRRKTSKAEIQLGSPPVPPVEYKTEVEHMVGGTSSNRLPTQRSEVAFPIAAITPKPSAFRSVSLEPEGATGSRNKPRERIIPIQLESTNDEGPIISSPPPARPPVHPLQQQRSLSQSQRSGSLSRQSTQESDTEGPEPIQKSPREFIIPIAIEGGGYVTPRAGSLEPSASDESTARPKQRSSTRFSRPRRMSSLLSDASEDEGFNSPFATLQRHSSLGRDDDDDRSFHMHRLRSSRPTRRPLEHNDSLSSAEEEDDDDDGFEILTAESLFSTLLSRVRSLTQRLNVEDGARPGFPSSRLMNQLTNIGHTSPSTFWNNVYGHQPEPLSRRLSESSQFSRSFSRDSDLGSTPWRRSMSRDVSDCDSVYSETSSTAGTLPRGSGKPDHDDAASENSSAASSYPYHYTPSLARRISHHYKRQSTEEGREGHTQTNNTNNCNVLPSPDEQSLRRDYLSSMGSSLAFLQSQDNAQYLPSSSRRLARTLSMRSANEDRPRSGSRRREYLPPSHRSISLLESKNRRNSGDTSLHGSSLSDAEDFNRKDYLPPTRRSLRLLDNDSRSVLPHRGSSASDSGDYYSHKPWEASHVLPPLPHNVPSYVRRKEPIIPRTYGRQRSAEMTDSLYGSQHSSNSRRLHSRILELAGEDSHDRPKHSSSLPSMAGGKNFKVKGNTIVPATQRGGFDTCSDVENQDKSICNQEIVSKTSKDTLPKSKKLDGKGEMCNTDTNKINDKNTMNELSDGSGNNNSSVKKPTSQAIGKNNTSRIETLEDTEKKSRSQIPSLLHFRSSSLCRESERTKSKTTAVDDEHASKSSKSSRSTPDRSILSKFFRQGSEERSKDDNLETSAENKDGDNTKKKTRRISRFLRPDFFDTPREESSYVKEKEAQKAAEAEIKKAKRVARRAALMEKKEKENAQKIAKDEIELPKSSDCIEPNPNTCNTNEIENKIVTEDIISLPMDDGVNAPTAVDTTSKSKVKSSSKASNLNESASEKQSNGSNNKNRFLHSLEKKLEKFRSSGDDVHSSGKSRVEKAIRSLRERSVTPRGSDMMTTESTLLKRAVSVDDVCAQSQAPLAKRNNASSSKLGSKVSSVLGLFRKLEDSPQEQPKVANSRPSMLSRLRRTQSVYAGSHSDSVLLVQAQEMLDTNNVKPELPMCQNSTISLSDKGDASQTLTNNTSISSETSGQNVVKNDTSKTLEASSKEVCTLVESVIETPQKINTENTVELAQQSQRSEVLDSNQKNPVKLIPSSVSSQDNKVSDKVRSRNKVSIVKDAFIQKDGVNVEKSATLSETQEKVNNKPSVKKVCSKKSVQSSSVDRTVKSDSKIGSVKSVPKIKDSTDNINTKEDITSVNKTDQKKLLLLPELSQESGITDANQKNIEKTVSLSKKVVVPQNTKDLNKTEGGNSAPKDKLTSEICKDHVKTRSKVVTDKAHSVSGIATGTSLVQNGEIEDNNISVDVQIKPDSICDSQLSCETVKTREQKAAVICKEPSGVTKRQVAKVDQLKQNKLTPVGGHVNDASLLVSPSEERKSICDGLPCTETMNNDEIKFAAVKQLDCYPDDMSSVISPVDESESLDSWSVCSDFEGQDFPTSPLPSPVLDEGGAESVEDRIRRKSFYSRFNDIKKKSHRKVSPSYHSRAPNYAVSGNQQSQALYDPHDLEDHLSPYNRKSPIPTRSSIPILDNNSNSIANENTNYELHNGYGENTHPQNNIGNPSAEKSVEKGNSYLEKLQYSSGQTCKKPNVIVSSYSNSGMVPQIPNINVRRKTIAGQLLRPTDFTPDVLRRSSLTKSRLPTASWERRATTPTSTRLTNPSNRSVRAGSYTDATSAEGEILLPDGKCNRFSSESSPSS